ncbi:unnamed protein product [Urochloa decumbens]|uniref:HTH myb-type domain-containing protein n=1 Tax=Urochloa decumbens TaxID=240449 RepID=A0ABC9E332_9POAL
MLEVSILRSPSKAADQRGFDVGLFPTSGGGGDCDDFMGVDDNLNLLESYIDFSCCDVPFFDADGDILPDLEVDPTDELLAEFSSSPEATSPAAEHDDAIKQQLQGQHQVVVGEEDEKAADERGVLTLEKDDKKAAAAAGPVVGVTTEEDYSAGGAAGSSDDTNKSSAAAKKKASKDSNGKRKVKVDWTPELHRKFVQAVEQLGIDKAVPSRILEIMGIECLTRHNIASHLQKYRSHRKHLMAREAEAASWAQKRHSMYAAAASGAPARKAAAAAAGPWVVPTTIGFPPPFCRPLHVWGHPPVAAAEAPPPVWPRHLRPWAPTVDPAAAAAYWNQQYNVRPATTACCQHQEVGSTSSGSSVVPDAAARHGAAAHQVSGAATPHHGRRPSAGGDDDDDQQAARRIAASARRAPVQGEHRRSHWRRFSEAMAAASAGSQAALPPQRHVRAAQARHTKGPTCCGLLRSTA